MLFEFFLEEHFQGSKLYTRYTSMHLTETTQTFESQQQISENRKSKRPNLTLSFQNINSHGDLFDKIHR